MGFYKNYRDMRSDVRRYNAAVRRANNLAGKGSSQLIHIETVSEIERYTMAKDADRLVAFNKDVQKWMNSVAAQLRASISSHSMRVATDLRPRMYTDKYGTCPCTCKPSEHNHSGRTDSGT